MDRVLRRGLSLQQLKPQVKLPRRHTEEIVSPTADWVATAAELWSTDQVQQGKALVSVDLVPSPTRRRKKQGKALGQTMEVLDRLPDDRSPFLQAQVGQLVAALEPLASIEQKTHLQAILQPETQQLKEALQRGSISKIIRASSSAWTKEMIGQLDLDCSWLPNLAARWAASQVAEECLREDCPLVWLIQRLIPIVPDEPSTEKYFLNCLQCWQLLPERHYQLLNKIRQALPLQTVRGVDLLLHFAFFRCWIPHRNDRKQLLAMLFDS